ncbi:MAG: hypothetical protein R3E32_24270 [Chitinophagales bacterium]
MQDFMVNYGIPLSQLLVLVALVLAVVFPVVYTLRNPKESGKTIAGIGIFAVILLLIWVTASSEIAGRFASATYSYVTPGIMKLVSFSITAGILFTVGAFILTVVLEIVNAVK